MKKWVWTLLFVAAIAILFMWTARENFQDTATLKGPPYGDSDYPMIVNLMSDALVGELQSAYEKSHPGQGKPDKTTLEGQRKLVDGPISDVMGDFHTSVYQPAKEALKESDVDDFVTSHGTSMLIKQDATEIRKLLKAYFVHQTAGAANAALTDKQKKSAAEATTTGYAALRDATNAGKDLTKACTNEIESKSWADVSAECKAQSATDGSSSSSAASAASTASTGDKCKDEVANKQWSDVSAECKAKVSGQKPSGNSTGGSSLIPASNAGGLSGASLTGGGGASKGNIWGPAYTGMGDNAGGDANGNSKRDYPTLIGPKPKESTMIEGAGIAGVSQHRSLVTSGALPSASSTGSDPSSQFFGMSRTPGDKDLVPNPYQEFTPSTGSSKTEPIPYLTDFSAFFH